MIEYLASKANQRPCTIQSEVIQSEVIQSEVIQGEKRQGEHDEWSATEVMRCHITTTYCHK
ncbi:Unknown protein sequence [Pseudomonas syringae pv. maculicola]|nr:hypothetical protein WX98_09570 [Pseudomonas syringae pv. persicae]KPB95035.1 Unknown protein sequence [Pseudomonas syringae pv. maculicola]